MWKLRAASLLLGALASAFARVQAGDMPSAWPMQAPAPVLPGDASAAAWQADDHASHVSATQPEFVSAPINPGSNPDLERRIQQLEAQLNALQTPAAPPVWNVPDAGEAGLFGSIEVTFLRPHISGSPSTFGLGPTVHRTIDSDYTTGVRYEMGYKGKTGFGIQGRYWSQNDSYTHVPPFSPNTLGIEVEATDLELTLDQRLRRFDCHLTAGVRYGRLEYSNPVASLLGVGLLTYEGVGPTVSAGARRTLGSSGISLFGNLRGSMLFGDIRNGAILTFMPRTTIEEEIMTIAESQFGLAWTRGFGFNHLLEVRAGWETQYWMNNTLSDDVYGIGSNLGLSGPAVALELKY